MSRPTPALRTRHACLATTALLFSALLAGAEEVTVQGRAFKVPDGFVIERVAGPPLVDRPITADFDEKGRLYVADSSGTNDPVKKQLAERPHRILRLEDTNGDGVFDKRTIFADKMMFPEGTMWLDGSLYVAAPPSIWKLTDTDDDGVADQRVEWFQGKTLTGCANDLHGPYRGPDGWIYWCKGAFAQQTYERPGKAPFVTRAAHIFRARPDGSGLEPVMTGGMDNPVDVVFTPGGERIFSTTFLQYPANGRRDGLIHAVYGGIYGKLQDVLFDKAHKWTSPEVMPVLVHLGPAAACGLQRYESESFGKAYVDNIFACCFNLHKVTRHVLKTEGATFSTVDEDFVVAPDLDFHPTDVIEDADGSLLIVDTGGWYKLCCPTSQLPKPDVLGGIYRVRRKGAPVVVDARGEMRLKALGDLRPQNVQDYVNLLGDPRPVVRKRAADMLTSERSRDIVVPALVKVAGEGGTALLRRHALWTLTRIDHPRARAAMIAALDDPDETVRQVALHSISLRREKAAFPKLIALLNGPSIPNRRGAAEALGRIGDPKAVPALFEAIRSSPDRVLEHSLIYALIEIDNAISVRKELATDSEPARRAALIALDQMDEGKIQVEEVAPSLTSPDPKTREIASWIAGRHPEWGDALAGQFRRRLGASGLSEGERSELTSQLARFTKTPAVRDLLAETLKGDAPRSSRIIALRAMAASGLKEMPAAWADPVASAIGSKNADLIPEAVATARALPAAGGSAEKLSKALFAIAEDSAQTPELRLNALAAIPGGLGATKPEILAFLLKQVEPDSPVAPRTTAANVLARATLNNDQLLLLADAIRSAGPIEIDRLLTPFERSKDDQVGLALIAALTASSAKSALRVDMLKPRVDEYGPAVHAAAEPLYAGLNVDAAKQKARLEELLPKLTDGDVRRGQVVFHSAKAACMTCHAVGYVGGNVGPDLTSIGKIRNDRDLLEAILFPSLSLVRSYEPVVVATKDGKVVNGLLRKDSADELVLVTGANQEARIPRGSVEEIRPGNVSVMPAGLDQQLTRQDLADLLAFLKSRK